MDTSKTEGEQMTLKEWYIDKSSENDSEKWRNSVAEIYSKHEGKEISEGRTVFNGAITAYLHQPSTDNFANNIRKNIKKYIPSTALELYHEIRYGGPPCWPPTSKMAIKMRKKVLTEKGYPSSDKSADTEWHRMKDIIKKHGALDGRTFRYDSAASD